MTRKNMNVNCLEGLRCPECGSLEPLDILMPCWVRWSDDGTSVDEVSQDYSFEDKNLCTCGQCCCSGTVADFRISNKKRYKGSKALARFVPQAWINNNAVDVDGEVYGDCCIDITDKVRKIGIARAMAIKDNTSESDNLLHDPLVKPPEWMLKWPGPFKILVERGIDNYFESLQKRK